MADPKVIQDKMDSILEKSRERDELLVKLDHSLRIQALWPEAFEHGKCTSELNGELPGIGVSPKIDESRLTFTIKRGDGSSRDFPVEDVPEALWRRCLPPIYRSSLTQRQVRERHKEILERRRNRP
jgi:hypothetical protein